MQNGVITRAAAALTVFILMAGCVSSGVQVKPDQLSEFKAGTTTVNDVIAKLGKPTTSMLMSDGTRMMSYSYIHSQARPASFIPVVGVFAGGADSQMATTMFRFDKEFNLISFSSSESQFGSSTGLAAGRPMEQTDQPRQVKE